jgi:predicted unusual protein kinase regulating ubiquinone biosynthesis (AarF/ABC1/UbiB family)
MRTELCLFKINAVMDELDNIIREKKARNSNGVTAAKKPRAYLGKVNNDFDPTTTDRKVFKMMISREWMVNKYGTQGAEDAMGKLADGPPGW